VNAIEAEKLTEKVKSFLEECRKMYPKTMLGHGARLGADGKPEIFVAFLRETKIPDEVNDVRIVSEVRPQAFLA
jgi:hypothetical protein